MFLKKLKLDNFIKNTTIPLRFTVGPSVILSYNNTILVGGSFRYKKIEISRLASLTEDSFSINSSYNSKFNNIVRTITQSDGKILVGGDFINYGGVTNRNRLIRLNSDGTLDTTFCNNAVDGAKFNNPVRTITTQSDGKILVGGDFIYGGFSGRARLIRLNSDGTLDTTFCNNAVDGTKFNNIVFAITVQSDGKILVGGAFINYGAITGRSFLIRLNSDGTLDTTFCNNAVDGNKFSNIVYAITVQSDGKILVGGLFGTYGGFTGRDRLVRLNSDGTLDTTFCNNAVDGTKFSAAVNTIRIQSDNKILISGGFIYGGFSGRARLIRLNSDGTLDTPFCNNAVDGGKFNNVINDISVQSDGKILLVGNFTDYGAVTGRSYLIRLNVDGTIDAEFCNQYSDSGYTSFSSISYTISEYLNNNIIIGGLFTNYRGTSRSSFIVLNENAEINSSFLSLSSIVYSSKVDSSNGILIGGSFLDVAGVAGRSKLVRYASDGSIDTSFCNNAVDSSKFSGDIYTIQTQSDGKILIGGVFTNYGGVTDRNRLIRLNSDGTLDTTFCNNAVDGGKFNNIVYAITVQSDGKILVGGSFTNYGAITGRSGLIRLNSDGTLDTTFCNNAVDGSKFNNFISSMYIQSDGKILVGGGFSNYGAVTGRNCLIRLNSDGTLDTTFCNNAVDGSKFNVAINSVFIQSDGKILVGGGFTNYGGVTNRNRLIRLNSDGTLDTPFCNNAVDGAKFSAAVNFVFESSSKYIYIAGNFTSYFCGKDSIRVADRFIKLDNTGISK